MLRDDKNAFGVHPLSSGVSYYASFLDSNVATLCAKLKVSWRVCYPELFLNLQTIA